MKKRTLYSFWLFLLVIPGALLAVNPGFRGAHNTAYRISSSLLTSLGEQPLSSREDPFASHQKSSSQPRMALQPKVDSQLPAPNLYFDCFSIPDGLSFSLVTSILQDRRGFLWIGTRYGLNRYDGYQFQVTTFDAGEDPLNDNYIRDLYEDRRGNLWISTYSDLVRRDGETGEFTHYKSEATDARSLGPGPIMSISEDQQGSLWVGTVNSLNRYEPSTNSFTRVTQGRDVTGAYFDRQGGFWLGTASGLLYDALGQPDGRGTKVYRKDDADRESLSTNLVRIIYEDRQGILWLGTEENGLNRLDPATGKVTRFQHDPANPDSLGSNTTLAILDDSLGRLWVGTIDGLHLLDRATGRFFRYQFNSGDQQSLINNIVLDLYQDRSGVVWVATAAGICKINETASRFTIYQQGTNQLPSEAGAKSRTLSVLSDNIITAIYQDRNGILWIGTELGGLNRLDRSTGSVTIYRHDPANPTSLLSGEVTAIYEDRSGTLWVGTSNGLVRFDPQTGEFTPEITFSEPMILAVLEDHQGNLWVGTSEGVKVKMTDASTFTAPPIGMSPLTTEVVQSMFLDRSGAIWVSMVDHGLYRLDPPDQSNPSSLSFAHFPPGQDDPKSPGASPIISFYDDSQGTLWMGSLGNGLIKYDRQAQTFSQFLPGPGVIPTITCIQGDDQGFLWMATFLGLALFDPNSETFTYLDSRDGLEFGSGMVECYQNEMGEFFFGGPVGLNSFFPGEILLNPNPPEVVITSLSLNNQPFRSDLLPGEQFNLPYKDNNLSFDFTALDFTVPAKNQYAYMMEGLDSDWIEAGTRSHADYPDLKPGAYTFRVKASNNSGVWNEQGAAVQITITPPFWQTWWFLGTMGLVVAGVVLGGMRLRVRGLEARGRDLEKQVHERTGALEQKTQELETLLAENTRLSQQSQDLAVLEERNRLARDLHDSITQSLYGMTLYTEVASQLLKSGDIEKTGAHLQELKTLALDSLAEMRLMIYELRPSVFEQEGLAAAIQARLDAVESRIGIKTDFTIQGEIKLTTRLEAGLYRIAQEALNNVIKHAHASSINIILAQNDQAVYMEIADDGVGFDPLQANGAGCLGLQNMRERAQELGAEFEISSQAGQGTRIILKRQIDE